MRCKLWNCWALGLLLASAAFAADAEVKLFWNNDACVVSNKAAHVNNGDKVKWTRGPGVASFEAKFRVSPFESKGGGTYSSENPYPLAQRCKRDDGVGCSYSY